MRFTESAGLMQTLKYSAQRLSRILTVPVTNSYRRVRRVLNPNGFTTRVMADVRKGGKELVSGKPTSLKDYFAVGNYYLAKKVVYIAAIVILVLPILYLKFLHPVIRTHFLTTDVVVNSAEMACYTGKVRLRAAQGGAILYRGPLSEGRITGQGALYAYGGTLVYQGDFLQEQYEGQGKTFWPNGQVQYDGGFSKNLYEGQGTLYDENGQILYQGPFSAGTFSGKGVSYQDGALLYRGDFAGGAMEGAGRLYAGRQVTYDGTFAAGAFHGAGREFDPVTHALLYDGEYVEGRYSGQGKSFDAATGNLVYEGGFYEGVYEGQGKLYDPETGYLLYEGGFRAGRKDGAGTDYDPTLGVKIFQGEYLLGARSGVGTAYDPLTGFVTESGQYRNDTLVVLDENGNVISGAVEGPSGETGESTGGGSGASTGGGAAGGTTQGASGGSAAGQGAQIYRGPTTASGSVDFHALAGMTADAVQQQFDGKPTSWTLSGGDVYVYADTTEHLGLTVRTDGSGGVKAVDVWNDAAVSEAKVGLTQSELTALLGQPTAVGKEAIGLGRMVSIRQSNNFFARLTNLSPESLVTVATYQTPSGMVQAVFQNSGGCLLLSVLA